MATLPGVAVAASGTSMSAAVAVPVAVPAAAMVTPINTTRIAVLVVLAADLVLSVLQAKRW